jgi:mannose/fructose-specific phosphotransferase system component IIA
VSPATGIVVAHGGLAASLVEAAEGISGIQGALVPISNAELGPEALRSRVESSIGSDPAIVFTDLASGSCTLASRAVGRDRSSVAVVTGVSLPMLLDFLFHRDLVPADLARRIARKGQDGIRVLTDRETGHDA